MPWINSVEKTASIPVADIPVKIGQLTLVLMLWLTSACSGYQGLMDSAGLTNQVVAGTVYRHRIMINGTGQATPLAAHWHVYIEGDGRAVTALGRPSLDPTPKTPLLLAMMTQDPMPALYLGRPCYYHTEDPNCSPYHWTLARYSRNTVDSMAAALQGSLPDAATITLIGHSGGGTLAVLLAKKLNNVNTVVTLAGNLQVAKWTQYHHYSPLVASLDPAAEPPLPDCINQYHFAGAQDEEILSAWIEEYAQRQPSSHFELVAGTDHRTGWPLWWTLVKLEPTIKTQRCDKITS
ncbi:MAG: alpha/beta hydrolase [Pseudomonadales bacterium]|nr:alpha/beta hydrolase [Pseudomonadales bacterium]RLU02975.1 MAG: alpha/beta hydrolase [Ketobacter sp.]